MPFPDHVHAGVEVGDKVNVVTRDGVATEIIVAEITDKAIVGEGQTVLFEDLSSIAKRSWNPIRNPCEDERPVGCSIPLVVTVLSEYHAEYGDKLQEPCTTHDFCYRFGLTTYGADRERCDTEFLGNMRSQCAKDNKWNIVGRTQCQLAADQMHAAVELYGEKYFHSTTSQYCEYAGPPASLLTK